MARRRLRTFRRFGQYRNRGYMIEAGRGGFSGSYGGYGLQLTPAWLLGACVGYTDLDTKIPAEITLAAASLPIKARGFGMIKGAAQGILMGNLIQSLVAHKGLSGDTSNFGV